MFMNMKWLKSTLRISLAVLTALVLVATPCLQARQLNHNSSNCSMSCCSGCSQNHFSSSETTMIEGSCCCRVSSPEPVTEIPFEAQPRPVYNLDILSKVTCVASDYPVTEAAFSEAFKIDIPSAQSRPLYLLNSTYLI